MVSTRKTSTTALFGVMNNNVIRLLMISLTLSNYWPPAALCFSPSICSTTTQAVALSKVLYSNLDGNNNNNNNKRASKHHHHQENLLLDAFKTAEGEIVNPYQVLKVSRKASRDEIKLSYRSLSRKYHPDGVRFREVLPGKCNNLGDVREEWERIKLAYEILSDKQMRARYDRNSSWADPGAAFGRAALGTIGWGILGIGKGIYKAGELAFHQILTLERSDHSTTTKDDVPTTTFVSTEDVIRAQEM